MRHRVTNVRSLACPRPADRPASCWGSITRRPGAGSSCWPTTGSSKRSKRATAPAGGQAATATVAGRVGRPPRRPRESCAADLYFVSTGRCCHWTLFVETIGRVFSEAPVASVSRWHGASRQTPRMMGRPKCITSVLSPASTTLPWQNRRAGDYPVGWRLHRLPGRKRRRRWHPRNQSRSNGSRLRPGR